MEQQVQISLERVALHRHGPSHRCPLFIGDRAFDRGHRDIEVIKPGEAFTVDVCEAVNLLRLHSGDIHSANPPQSVIDAKREYDSANPKPVFTEESIRDFRVRS